ncbi:MAG: hypothetical protein IKU43_09330 [Clostridia bacterium]|nr:hypothetical protein [Clostridia bacterium]
MKYISDIDRSFIENKYHLQSEPFNPLSRFAYHGVMCDYTEGLDDSQMRAALSELYEKTRGEDHALIKAKAFAFVLDNAKIAIDEHDYFPCLYNWGRPLDGIFINRWQKELFESIPGLCEEIDDFKSSGIAEMWLDTNHVVPDWRDILSLGFAGLLERAQSYHEKYRLEGSLDEKQEAFFSSIEIEYEAILRFVKRLYDYASSHPTEKSELIKKSLDTIYRGKPQNTFETLMLMYIYFLLSESVDSFQVRSMGHGIDRTLWKYYKNDIKNGTFTRDEIKGFLAYFMLQFSAIGNYWGQPMYLCATDFDNKTDISELTYDFLDVYDELCLYNPKLQFKITPETDKKLICRVLDMIRHGKNSFVLCCVPGITKSLMSSYGTSLEEARDCDISGCNEMHVRADEANMISSVANLSKAISYVFDNGYDTVLGKQMGLKTGDVSDFTSFDEFYEAVMKQITYIIDRILCMARKYEHFVAEVDPSVMLSATMERALKKKVDAYAFGVKYPTSSILLNAFATTVDSVLAIKELVFDKGEATLTDFKNALDNNWEGYEILHRKALGAKLKYGVNDKEADMYATAMFNKIAVYITGQKNSRGSIYKTGVPSTTHFLIHGRTTKATPDGRRMGEELSKNTAPVIGTERNGVTGTMLSAMKTSMWLFSEAYVLDLMLHPSSVQGDDGLEAMYGLVMNYMKNDGISIQFNVFDSKMLRDAQKNPDKYKNLQVRVSGWNVLWNNMSKAEQDAYIVRSDGLGK